MSVRIPIEVSSTGAESVKKIKKDIADAKKDLENIESKVNSTETAKTTTIQSKIKSGKSVTKIDKVLENDLGVSKAGNILGYATNPTGAVLQQLFKIGALPAALIGAPILADKVIAFLQQEGNILNRFFDDRIDNRTNSLRDKNIQQRILQGFDALRISTIDGDYNPRNSFNTFEVFKNNPKLLENYFKIRKSVT